MNDKISAALAVVVVANVVRGVELYRWPQYREIYGEGWFRTIWPTLRAGIAKAFTSDDFARAVRKVFVKTGV